MSRGFLFAFLATLLAVTSTQAAKPVFESKLITARTPGHAVDVDVDISGAKQLFLVVTDGGNSYSCDWADWAEPRLIGESGEKKLTELKWKSAKADWGQVRVGKNAGGGALSINGQPVSYGIGTHANSVIAFDLPQGVSRFKARAGLDNGGTDQGNGGASSVKFLVYTEQPPIQVAAAPAGPKGNLSPADALDALEVGDGLELSYFAHEPMLLNPTNIDVDHLGRVWVCEVINYRRFRNKDHPERTAGDRILILEDTDGDGEADKSTTFYQGRDIDSAHGVCVLGNKAIVSANDSVYVLTDTDGDWKADKKDVLFTGISGTQHDHGIHSFTFGPDGKLYFNFGNSGKQIKTADGKPIVDLAGNVVNDSRKPYQEGMVFRCNMDGSEFETLGWNFRNNWEVAVDSFGTMWQSDNDDDGNRGVRINFVMEFGNYGYKDELTGAGWREPRTGMHEEIPKRHWHLNDPGVVPNLLQTGAGSPTGICVYEGDLLPARFQNQMIHCDAGPNIVRAYPVKVDGAGYAATIENVLEGVRDQWFRPSDVCVAPDGSLLIADWYDPGVGGHRMQDVDKGRIFRIAPPKSKWTVPKQDLTTIDGAVKALKSPNLATRYLAWTFLHQQQQAAEAALKAVFENDKNPRHRARALWLLGKIEACGEHYVNAALADDDPNIRIVGLRLARQLKWDLVPVIEKLVDDKSAAVRRECAIALRGNKSDEAPGLWAKLALQHDGKDRWYLEALGIGAEGQWTRYRMPYIEAITARPDYEVFEDAGERDLTWRARNVIAITDLQYIILHTENAKDIPRYFRALDFQSPKRRDLLNAHLMGLLTQSKDNPQRDLIAALALKHMRDVDFSKSPELKQTIDKVLADIGPSEQYVSLVKKFGLKDHYPQLLTIARENADEQLGVEAMRTLLDAQQMPLVRKSLEAEDLTQVSRTLTALGYSGHGRATGILTQAMNDKKRPASVRRDAVTALAMIRPGALKLIELAKANQLDSALKSSAASGLHTAQWRDVKEQAAKLFPLPATKGNKPLPPIEQLLKRRGDVKKGRIAYNTTATCVNCHVVNNVGRDVGPNLSEIGKKLSRQAMYQSIIYPSAGISHNYESYQLAFNDGTTANGLLVSETDSSITLKDAKAIVRTYKREDVLLKKKQSISLMPADLQKVMTEDDLVNVVEYLMTLTKAKDFSKPAASK